MNHKDTKSTNTDEREPARVPVDSTALVEHDAVNHPRHYTKHPSGVECITVTEHMGFCLGNAVKYIWRAGEKGDAIEDLEKARWYLTREIERRTKCSTDEVSRRTGNG